MAGSRGAFTAKVRPPSAHGLVRDRLSGLGSCRVGLVVAPAGHGKTTLLAQVAAGFPGPVAWYRADGADRVESVLLSRLAPAVAAALAPLGTPEAGGDRGPEPAGGQDRRPAVPATVDGVLHAFDAARDVRALLVVDDFHEIAGTAGADAVLTIVAGAPEHLQVLVGARGDAELDLSRLRLAGDVVVVDADDLRFRSWEVERLFRDVYQRPLRPEDAAALTARTEGWAAGLAMFDLMTRSRSPAERHNALADMVRGSRLVRGYLVREVLDELPPDLREFLRRTSALGVLSGRLCDALLDRQDSQEVLEDLERRQLFTTSDDAGRRFRYHQVLQDHLELELSEQLGQEAVRRWYGRAATLLADEGEAWAAFRALVRAQDWTGVAALLRDHGADVVDHPMDLLAESLPNALREHDPWLVLAAARRLTAHGALAQAVTAYQRAESLTLDDEVRALCRRERQAVAMWLPPEQGRPTNGPGAVRAGTRAAPARFIEAALAIPGPAGMLAAAGLAMLSGRSEQAEELFLRASRHPTAGRQVNELGAYGAAAIRLLRGSTDPEETAWLEGLVRRPTPGLHAWWHRVGWALVCAGRGDVAALALLAEDADADDDAWGGGLVRVLIAVVSGREDPRGVEAARIGRAAFEALEAPVLAHWCHCLAVLAGTPEGSQAQAAALAEVAREGRALGVREVLPMMADLVEARSRAARAGVRTVGSGSGAGAEAGGAGSSAPSGAGAVGRSAGAAEGEDSGAVARAPGPGGNGAQAAQAPAGTPPGRTGRTGDAGGTGAGGDDASGGAGGDAGSGAETGAALPAPRARPVGREVEAAVRVRLLGRFDVAVGGVPVDLAKARPRVRATLQMLALHAGTFVHREVLAETLWPDVDPEAGQRGLQVAISALRGLLEPDGAPRHSERLPRRGDAYALVLPAGCTTDVQDLDSALARARDARRAGDAESAVRSWREAVDLYRGPLLPEQGSAEWVLPERDRLRQATADAAEALGRALAGAGDDRAALDALRQALDLDPFRDGAWRALVQLHEAQGDRAAAQAARLRHRRVLAELGVSAEDI